MKEIKKEYNSKGEFSKVVYELENKETLTLTYDGFHVVNKRIHDIDGNLITSIDFTESNCKSATIGFFDKGIKFYESDKCQMEDLEFAKNSVIVIETQCYSGNSNYVPLFSNDQDSQHQICFVDSNKQIFHSGLFNTVSDLDRTQEVVFCRKIDVNEKKIERIKELFTLINNSPDFDEQPLLTELKQLLEMDYINLYDFSKSL